MGIVDIKGKKIGVGMPVYMIAEIGINHNGSLKNALELITVASEAGFDAVKFQKRTINIVYSEEELAKPRESIFGNTNRDLKNGLEFSLSDYQEIDSKCRKVGIHWFASPWDVQSVLFLENFDVCAYKIASACLTNRELLETVSSKNKPIFLSTGMSTLDQIRTAVKILSSDKLIMMHTVSMYPAKNNELNLHWINELRNEFDGVPIGYSGHEVGVLPSVIAASTYGAVCIERHVTLDRAQWGSDQSASLEPQGMRKLVGYIRDLPGLESDYSKKVLDQEIPVLSKLRTVIDF